MTDLDEFERLLREATPGPWRYELDGEPHNDMRHAVLAEVNDLWVAACYRSGTTAPDERSPAAEMQVSANAALIAGLRNAAEELIRDARRLAHLERMFRVMSPNIDGYHVWTFTNIPTLRGPNLRAAIDATIAKTAGGRE